MELLGCIALGAMGITLGLIGAGGSILTIPILIYLLNVPVLLATSYSLIMVGMSAFIAAIHHRHHILFKKAILFLAPSVLGIFIVRYFVISSLPETLGGLLIDDLLIVLLVVLMVIAGYFMIKKPSFDKGDGITENHGVKIVFIALSLGAVMGLVGVGGGFLIIPTLVIIMGFTMQEAVSTSLFIIATNSLIGFAADRHNLLFTDWVNLAKYSIPALIGMFIGLYIAKFIKGELLKRAFGYFIWVVGAVTLTKEFFL